MSWCDLITAVCTRSLRPWLGLGIRSETLPGFKFSGKVAVICKEVFVSGERPDTLQTFAQATPDEQAPRSLARILRRANRQVNESRAVGPAFNG